MDKKAKTILFKTYWSAGGWISENKRTIDPADFEYAKAKGVMFDNISLSKAELLDRLDKAVQAIPLKTVTDAFLSGFTNNRPDWRSGLASYVNAHRLARNSNVNDHYLGHGHNIDINVLNFERIKWGGVRHFQGIYNLIDLELLMNDTIPSPTEVDKQQFTDLLDVVDNAPTNETASKLRDRLKGVVPMPKQEIDQLLETLGCAEILLPLSQDRKGPGGDWHFMAQWRGEDKYRKRTCAFYFGDYGIE